MLRNVNLVQLKGSIKILKELYTEIKEINYENEGFDISNEGFDISNKGRDMSEEKVVATISKEEEVEILDWLAIGA